MWSWLAERRGLDLILCSPHHYTISSCTPVLMQCLLETSRWISHGSPSPNAQIEYVIPATIVPFICSPTCTPCCYKTDHSPHSCPVRNLSSVFISSFSFDHWQPVDPTPPIFHGEYFSCLSLFPCPSYSTLLLTPVSSSSSLSF